MSRDLYKVMYAIYRVCYVFLCTILTNDSLIIFTNKFTVLRLLNVND